MTSPLIPSLDDPFAAAAPEPATPTPYESALREGAALRERPHASQGIEAIAKQHQKGRMTVWERIRVLTAERPDVLFENWGPNLDGASLVTAVLRIGGVCAGGRRRVSGW